MNLIKLMNDYKVLSLIGQGTYGTVLKAECIKTGEIVAIKKFKEDYQLKDSREVTVLQSLSNNHIVRLQTSFISNHKLCLVFDFVNRNLLEEL